MGDEKTENPRDAVFTTALWDGGFALADWELHLQRLGEHAKLLRIELPNDLSMRIANFFQEMAEKGLHNHSTVTLFG